MKEINKHIPDPSDEIIKAYLKSLHRKDYREHFDKSGQPSKKAVESAKAYKIPLELRKQNNIEDTELDNVYLIDSKKEGKTIFYIHGGAYWDQPTSFHYSFLRKLVDKVRGKAYIPVYPKAPCYHLEDVHAFLKNAYDKCLAGIDSKDIVMMGDSAGGGCTLALASSLKEQGYEIPQLILLSPWLDLSCEKKDKKRDTDPWLSRTTLRKQGEIYADKTTISSPLASPLFANLDGIDDITIFAGTSDILHYDAILLEEKYPKIELHVYEKAFHDFALFPIGIASDKAFRTIVSKLSEDK